MKKLILLAIFVLSYSNTKGSPPVSMEKFFNDFKMELNEITENYYSSQLQFHQRLFEIKRELKNKNSDARDLVSLLIEKDEIKEKLELQGAKYNLKLAQLRYEKGMDLIKLLYEKILDLDHHFTALNTYQNIADISNPNSYPEFLKSKESLTKNIKSKSSIDIPDILKSNIYVSLATTVVSSFMGSGDKQSRKKELDDISCILDFTAVMHSDLNIIYYETEFLIDNNKSLTNEINSLFKNYTKVIGYRTSLDECRNSDDWDNVSENLDNFLQSIDKALQKESGSSTYRKGIKSISNIEFALDKVISFLNKYSNFVDQGSKYYNKFYKILNNYKNVDKCTSKLPAQYEDLKSDIKLSIEKFQRAYDIGELQGSAARDLIYGSEEAF